MWLMLPGISECRSVLIDPFEHLHTYILQLIYDGNEQIDTLRRPPGVLRRPGDGRHHRHELLPRRPIPLRPQRHRLRCNGKGRPQRRAPARRNRRHPVQEVWYACCSALLSLISNYIRIALSLFLSTVAWFSYGYKCTFLFIIVLLFPSSSSFFFLFQNSQEKKTEYVLNHLV
jgi:hypothetical protein